MLPIAVIDHQMTGRLRLRIGARRGDVPFFQGIVQALSKLPEIKEVDANPLTGSILIHHSGSSQAITAEALEQGLFQLGPKQSKEAQSKAPPSDSGPMDTIATGLAGLGLFQVTQGQVIGNAAENFWNAYGAQRILGRPDIAAGFALLGIFQVLRGQLIGAASSLFFYFLVARQLASFDRAAAAFTDSAKTSASTPGKDPTSS